MPCPTVAGDMTRNMPCPTVAGDMPAYFKKTATYFKRYPRTKNLLATKV
jgi:hypothetical protein